MNKPTLLTKYIFEIRYSPLISTFDRRGVILEKIWKPFESKAKHWRVENVAVNIQDKEENPTKKIYVSHLRSFIAYENPDSEGEFNDDAKKFLKLLVETFPEIKLLERAGYRRISFKGGSSDLNQYYNSLQRWLATPLPTTLPINDAALALEHNNGRIAFGSTKQSDGFIEREFPNYKGPDNQNVLHIDVDSWTNNIKLDKPSQLNSVFIAAQETTKATIDEIEQSIGW